MELNCDLGEGEAPEWTAGLCSWVRRINVACGGHAGDDASMDRCIRLARQHGLLLGAHPGLPGAFGRGEARLDADALVALLDAQVFRLELHAAKEGMDLMHVKLHGSLYHAVERDHALARALAEWARDERPGLELVGLPNGRLRPAAIAAGVPFIPEGFLDRGYRPDGSLVPRGEPGATLAGEQAVERRLNRWLDTGGIDAIDGTWVRLDVRTWCVHADTPGALDFVVAAARALGCAPGVGPHS